MKVHRKKKLKKREEKARRQESKAKEGFSRILKWVGVDLDIKRLPPPAQTLLCAWRFPQPIVNVDFDDDSPDRIEEIVASVYDTIEHTILESPRGAAISACDFFRYSIALQEFTALIVKKQWGGRFSVEFQNATVRLEEFRTQFFETELLRLFAEIDAALAPFTRLDSAIYWYTPKLKRNGIGKALFTVTVHKAKAQMLKIASDRGTRPAYRVGGSFGLHGLYWCCVPKRLFGVDADGFYPVYIQDHAILRLHERLPLKGWEADVHESIGVSLINPQLTISPAGDQLIEYRFYDWKVGYLPVEVIDDKVLIKTFLFITMKGTPEAQRLYRNCGLMRRDIEALAFDSLDTFVNTDVQEDEEIRALLGRCGCGHLLEMAGLDDRTELIRGRAREIRRYLGMKTI